MQFPSPDSAVAKECESFLFSEGNEARVRVGAEYEFEFHPDFICKLDDGRILAVEYKGKDRWLQAADDREIGGLWEDLSGGKCLFMMVTDKDWKPITEKIGD